MKRILIVLAILFVGSLQAAAQFYPGDGDAAKSPPAPPPNNPPVWTDIPVVNCTESAASSTSFVTDFVNDPESDTIALTDGGGTAFPLGVTINDTTDSVDCSGGTTAGNTVGHLVDADDNCVTNCSVDVRPVTSASFAINIAAAGGGGGREDILTDMRGFADSVSTDGGAGGTLVTVTNLNNSGTGSLRQAVADASGPTWIRFTKDLTGTITNAGTLNFNKADMTIDGRGADIKIKGGSGVNVSIRQDAVNFVMLYIKLESATGGDADAFTTFRPANGVWLYHTTHTGAGDDQYSIRIQSTAYQANVTLQAVKSSGADGTGPFLIGGGTFPSSGDQIRFTMLDSDVSGGARGPRSSRAWTHIYNNYHHNWTGGYLINGIEGQAYIEANYVDNPPTDKTYAKPVTSVTRGWLRDTGDNNLNGGAIIDTRSTPIENVFTPSSFYTYTAVTADTAMRDAIIANAGYKLIPFPGDPP